jgi:preprotein translocase subunit SecE
MANKQLQQTKTSKALEILRTEYPFERILLGVLGLLVVLLGVYLVEGKMITITRTEWWIFNTEWKRTTFSIIVIILGTVSFLMAIWPFFAPSIAEMKKVSIPNRNAILNHIARVFGFIIVLSLFFTLLDWPLRKIFEWLAEIGA